MNKRTQEDIIFNFILVHGNNFNYEFVKFLGVNYKVLLECNSCHTQFWQLPSSHLKGVGCKKCKDKESTLKRTSNINTLITRTTNKFGEKYGYDEAIFINVNTKCKLKCNECKNYFYQTPACHVNGSGLYCTTKGCLNNKYSNFKTQNEYIEEAKKVHKGFYLYHKFIYIDSRTKGIYVCPKHGDFEQRPDQHLQADGCPKCGEEKRMAVLFLRKSNTEDFIKKAKEIHGDTIDYSKTIYTLSHEKSSYKCNDCKLIFWQTPNLHLIGIGCPNCNNSTYEQRLFKSLNNIFPDKKIINGAKLDWLINKDGHKRQHLDFYFPEFNIAIEYQGKQHFQSVSVFGGDNVYIKTQEQDNRKLKLCTENNCKLLYFTYTKRDIPKDYPHKVFYKENELIETINKEIHKSKNLIIKYT